MTFKASIRTCLQKYATFSGRASRSEYWYFFLFNWLVGLVANALDTAPLHSGGMQVGPIGLVASLALLVPGLAVASRRLHDTDRSFWWILIVLIPVVGLIVLLVFLVSKGSPGVNLYGDDPLAGPGGEWGGRPDAPLPNSETTIPRVPRNKD